MKLELKTLCSTGVLLFAGDAFAHNPNAFSNASDVQSNGMRDIEVIKEYGNAKVVVDHLDNAKTVKKDANGNRVRVFRDRTEPVSGITILGSVCPNVDIAKKVFYEGGISVNFYIQLEKQGKKLAAKTYELVDLDKKAFYSGVSHFRGKSNLNNSTIGVMINTWGFYEKDKEKANIYKKEDLGKRDERSKKPRNAGCFDFLHRQSNWNFRGYQGLLPAI